MSLSLNKISKSFGEKTVLSDFSYDFPTCGIVAITGSSGIGKTTLLKIISGLLKNDSGEVVRSNNETISYAFQEHRLFPNLSALSNLTDVVYATPSQDDIIESKAMLYRLGFTHDQFSLLPDEMSGGMRQRISLARAFLKPSSIIILDEPTKELDPSLISNVAKIINEIQTNHLIILATHDYDFLNALDTTVISF